MYEFRTTKYILTNCTKNCFTPRDFAISVKKFASFFNSNVFNGHGI